MKINCIYHILKSFEINKYYYPDDWLVDGKIMINEVFYIEPIVNDCKKYNIHINAVNSEQVINLINECICDDEMKYSMSYRIYSLDKNRNILTNFETNMNINKLISLLENNGYVDHNIKEKEIFLNENFHLKPDDFRE